MPIRTTLKTAAVAAAALALALPALAADHPWKPDHPITIIVPWAAGGSTDQVTRVVAGEVAKALNATVVVENQPGASGSIGTKNAWEDAHDGYTWTAGAAQDLGAYPVLGMLKQGIKDWHLYLDVANVPVISVNPDSPYKDFGDFLKAMKTSPNKVTVATAGVISSGHAAMAAVKAAAPGTGYKEVTYDGGNPAVIATVSGETQATSQLGVEEAEMIRAGKLRPLAVLSDQPLEIKGYGAIPPITKWIPDFKAAPNYFGIFVPADVPADVTQTLDEVWKNDIANSQTLKNYAASRGAIFAPYYGKTAQQKVMPAVEQNAWQLYSGGKAKVSPETVGIAKP